MKYFSFLCLLITSTITMAQAYSDAEKIMQIKQKLVFFESQKQALQLFNRRNKLFYKQAKDIAAYGQGENFAELKKQIKSAVKNITESSEYQNYRSYCVMLKTPLIGRDNIKAKDIPVIRPDQALARKINDILADHVSTKFLREIDVLTYFETLLNYTFDLLESQLIVEKLTSVELLLIDMQEKLQNNESDTNSSEDNSNNDDNDNQNAVDSIE